MKNFLVIFLILLFPVLLSGQIIDDEADKCGSDLKAAMELLDELGDNWGYAYDDLLLDLDEWESSEFITIDSIGESTLGRQIYELTVTDYTIPDTDKHRIYIHARTHPGEVQAFWVTDEIINFLLDDNEIGALLRTKCIFHIVPMYNPDGVELEYPRENANDVDIESNWGSSDPEDEVVNLKNRFEELMLEDNPIEIALNMHSAVACKRYFVYHHANGTSASFADLEEEFITDIWNHYPDGMEPYYYYVSWASGTPDRYPESWWWINHGANVMALTYEDMNCTSAGSYDKTASAILNGITDYLVLGTSSRDREIDGHSIDLQAYPNPFSEQLSIEWNPVEELKSVYITDLLGRIVFQLNETEALDGKLFLNSNDWNSSPIPEGIYFLNMRFENRIESAKLVKK